MVSKVKSVFSKQVHFSFYWQYTDSWAFPRELNLGRSCSQRIVVVSTFSESNVISPISMLFSNSFKKF